jgi:hypothetical protein
VPWCWTAVAPQRKAQASRSAGSSAFASAASQPFPLGSTSVAVHRLTAPQMKVPRNSVRVQAGIGRKGRDHAIATGSGKTPFDIKTPAARPA